MTNDDRSKTSQHGPEVGFLGLLRALALIALVIGTVGSLVFMFRAGEHSPRLLLILFTIWVLSPFVALFWANTVSKRWPALTRATLYCVMLIVAIGSLAIYGEWVNVKPAGSANAALFVTVPPLSWLFIIIVLLMARFMSGGFSHRDNGN
jgi:hypothetical protein